MVTLQYLADTPRLQVEKPYRIRGFDIKPDDGIDLTNMEWEGHDIVLNDTRTASNVPDYDGCGFKWIEHKAQTTPGYDDESIIAYCDEMIALLHQHVDAEQVLCYDMRVG
jgi:hypothetical protein